MYLGDVLAHIVLVCTCVTHVYTPHTVCVAAMELLSDVTPAVYEYCAEHTHDLVGRTHFRKGN